MMEFTEELELKIIEYYTTPHSLKETVEEFGLSNRYQLTKILDKYGVNKHSKETSNRIRLKAIEKTNLERYGVKCNWGSKDPKLNGSATRIEKYGTSSVLQIREFVDKVRITKEEKYGDPNYNNIKQGIQTSNKRYGGVGFEAETLKNKAQKTCIKKYGKINYMQSEDSKNNFQEYSARRYQTMKEKNSFRFSKSEELFYSSLKQKFTEENIAREYKNEAYPFKCDFYIKSLDLYIELNITWTHGGHEFDPQNKNDIEKLNLWKKKGKTSKYYIKAIDTWTVTDPQKIKIAKEHNLNYLVFYTEDSALIWLNSLKGDESSESRE